MARVRDLWERILLFMTGAAAACVSAAFAGIALRRVSPEQAAAWFAAANGAPAIRAVCSMLAAASLLAAFRFIRLALPAGRSGLFPIERQNAYGEVRISHETVRALALGAAARMRGLKDTKAKIRVRESALDIELSALAEGSLPIPALCEEIQRSVKVHVEEMTGIPVAGVSVHIRNVGGAGLAATSSRA